MSFRNPENRSEAPTRSDLTEMGRSPTLQERLRELTHLAKRFGIPVSYTDETTGEKLVVGKSNGDRKGKLPPSGTIFESPESPSPQPIETIETNGNGRRATGVNNGKDKSPNPKKPRVFKGLNGFYKGIFYHEGVPQQPKNK